MIQIKLPDSVDYTAGSRILGTVSISDEKDSIDIQNLSIPFSGQCNTGIEILTSTVHWDARYTRNDKGILSPFRQSLLLFESPNTRQAECAWPFSFTFPSNCELPQADVSAPGPFTFNADPGQLLPPPPPSCSDTHVKPMSSGHLRFSISCERKACVVTKDSIQRSRSSNTKSSLTYLSNHTNRHLRATPCFMSRRTHCQSMHPPFKETTRGAAVPSQSFRERIVSTKSEHKRRSGTATIELKVRAPTIAVVNEALPLVLSIDHDTEISTTPSPPVVPLKDIKAIMKADTAIRCENDRQMGNWSRDYTVIDQSFTKPTPITKYGIGWS